MIDIEALDRIRARNVILQTLRIKPNLADVINSLAQADVTAIKTCLTNTGFNAHRIVRQFQCYLALIDAELLDINLPIQRLALCRVFLGSLAKLHVEHTAVERDILHVYFLLPQVNVVGNNLEFADAAIHGERLYPLSCVDTTIREFDSFYANMSSQQACKVEVNECTLYI